MQRYYLEQTREPRADPRGQHLDPEGVGEYWITIPLSASISLVLMTQTHEAKSVHAIVASNRVSARCAYLQSRARPSR